MRIAALVAGIYKSTIFVFVEPHDSIDTLFEKLANTYIQAEMPYSPIAAYSIVHTRPSGLRGGHPDYTALVNGDPCVVAQYLTPAARIDLTNAKKKTVRDYFGDHVAPETLSIVFTWPRELIVEEQKRRARGRQETIELHAKWRKEREQTWWRMTTTTASAPPNKAAGRPTIQEPADGEYTTPCTSAPAAPPVASPRQWQWPWQVLASSYLPLMSCAGCVSTLWGAEDDGERKSE